MNLALLIAALIVGTWNGNWFPSGRAEHRAHPDVERATTLAAARMLASGLDAIDPLQTNDVILVLNEIRGLFEAENLVANINRRGLRVASISAYRRRDRFDQQQDVIATTLPVASATWSKWKPCGSETPPRGAARAALVVRPAVTTIVYAVHLKSNYGATTPEIRVLNRLKRAHAIEQLAASEKSASFLVIAGDFNADRWRKEFVNETLFSTLDGMRCEDMLALLPPKKRGTHPHKRYGNSTLDHIFVRGFRAIAQPIIVPNDGLSDHHAVFVQIIDAK